MWVGTIDASWFTMTSSNSSPLFEFSAASDSLQGTNAIDDPLYGLTTVKWESPMIGPAKRDGFCSSMIFFSYFFLVSSGPPFVTSCGNSVGGKRENQSGETREKGNEPMTGRVFPMMTQERINALGPGLLKHANLHAYGT